MKYNSKTLIEKVFKKGFESHHYANTAYPLDGKKVWKDFRVSSDKSDEEVRKQWTAVDEMGLYVHIPFCKKRCLYCEYTVLSGEEANMKNQYVDMLNKEIELYSGLTKGKKLIGLDLGGGTPTTLTAPQINRILNQSIAGFNLDQNFGVSIETTPKIAATEKEKLVEIRKAGIERISMGMQTIDAKVLKKVGREDGSTNILKKATENIRDTGFEKFNIDIMYGFAGQSLESFLSTANFAVGLDPEYITLYRMRYKGTQLENQLEKVKLEDVNKLYSKIFSFLNEKGYKANPGKNTFSRIEDDPGTSRYLTKRVIEGVPYLGLGLGAQSMSLNSIHYNKGAASKKLGGYVRALEQGHFPVQDIYALPDDEIMAKMISVSFYFGGINTTAFKKRFGVSLESKFKDTIEFLKERKLMEFKGDFFGLTETGKNYVNGIIPLFYSHRSQENLLTRRS
jgi:oxygen-independent coproporphyrinogen-3 oxidase